MAAFVIPADYGLALLDANAYASFVASDWTLPQLRTHLVGEMGRGAIIAWGTGAPGNWRVEVEVADAASRRKGFREFKARVRATGKHLHLTSYDELTAAAQFEDTRLPRSGTGGWVVTVAPGEYDCRVVQFYNPAEAESEAVFTQETPHFVVELVRATGKGPRSARDIPWFPAG